jgi:hypothetical protein
MGYNDNNETKNKDYEDMTQENYVMIDRKFRKNSIIIFQRMRK